MCSEHRGADIQDSGTRLGCPGRALLRRVSGFPRIMNAFLSLVGESTRQHVNSMVDPRGRSLCCQSGGYATINRHESNYIAHLRFAVLEILEGVMHGTMSLCDAVLRTWLSLALAQVPSLHCTLAPSWQLIHLVLCVQSFDGSSQAHTVRRDE